MKGKTLYHAWILFNKDHVQPLARNKQPYKGHLESTCLICLVGQDILKRTITSERTPLASSFAPPSPPKIIGTRLF